MGTKLQYSDEKSRLISEYTSDLVALTTFSINPVYTYISPSHKRIMGYEPEDLIGRSGLDLIHPDDKKKLLPLLKKYASQKVKKLLTGKGPEIFETVQFRVKDKSGIWHYLESTVNILKDEMLFISRDITDRKQVEDELKENARFLSNILSSIHDGISILDKDMNILMVNTTMKQWYAHAMPLVGKKCYAAYYGRSEPCKLCPSCQTIKTGNPAHEVMPRINAVGTVTGWLDLHSYPLIDVSTGEFAGVIEYVRDITEHKKADEALRESERKLRSIIGQSPDGIVLTDEQGVVIEWNLGAERITGIIKERALGSALWDIQSEIAVPEKKNPHRREQIKATITEILKTKRSPFGNIPSEKEFIRTDGTRGVMQTILYTIETDKGYMLGSIIRDISDSKRLDKELQKIEKLESLGILAGGIAHDFNNIIAAILGNVSLSKMSVKPEEKIYKRLTDTEKACERAKDLTRQLLTFAKGGAPIKEAASIAEIISDTASFALRGSNVQYQLHIAENLWTAEVDAGQVSQVVQNLIINANQAMPDGGIILIRAENVDIDTQKAIPLSEGKYIMVSVRDQGVGIPKEYISKIFDPFFSTKQRGSGLGLASCYSIIISHGGYIAVESEPGSGSTFTFYLPASEKKIERDASMPEHPLTGKGKILVMDDDEMIRDMARAILDTLGYEAVMAKDGSEAIDHYRKAQSAGAPFSAVIVDLTVIGGMGGEETMKKLLDIDPEVRAIVSSGYSNDPIMADFKKYGFRGVIAKPYKIVEMSVVLNEVISKPGI